MEIIAGIICGMVVCAFGMWCFIKGQQNAIALNRNELPEQIKNPVTAAAEVVQDVKDIKAQGDIAQQNLSIQNQLMDALRGSSPEKGV